MSYDGAVARDDRARWEAAHRSPPEPAAPDQSDLLLKSSLVFTSGVENVPS